MGHYSLNLLKARVHLINTRYSKPRLVIDGYLLHFPSAAGEKARFPQLFKYPSSQLGLEWESFCQSRSCAALPKYRIRMNTPSWNFAFLMCLDICSSLGARGIAPQSTLLLGWFVFCFFKSLLQFRVICWHQSLKGTIGRNLEWSSNGPWEKHACVYWRVSELSRKRRNGINFQILKQWWRNQGKLGMVKIG